MNKPFAQNTRISLGVLFTLTIAIAVVGIAAEIIFITNHLELIGREISLLTIGKIPY